jgi:hypothetical protein
MRRDPGLIAPAALRRVGVSRRDAWRTLVRPCGRQRRRAAISPCATFARLVTRRLAHVGIGRRQPRGTDEPSTSSLPRTRPAGTTIVDRGPVGVATAESMHLRCETGPPRGCPLSARGRRAAARRGAGGTRGTRGQRFGHAPAPASSCPPSGARWDRPGSSRRRYRSRRPWASGRAHRGSGASCGVPAARMGVLGPRSQGRRPSRRTSRRNGTTGSARRRAVAPGRDRHAPHLDAPHTFRYGVARRRWPAVFSARWPPRPWP